MYRLIAIVFAILCGSSVRMWPCTMFTASHKGVTLAAFNNDWWDPHPRVFFIPGTNNAYGRICFRFDFPQGGMNEKGLVWDWLACPKVAYTNSAGKEVYPGQWVFDDILARCATVEEGVALFRKYDLSQFSQSHFLLVDKSGKSAVVEGDNVFFGPKKYQVLTNFRIADGKDQSAPCPRYAMTERALRDGQVSVASFRKALASAHVENSASPTQYSYVADLTHGRLYLYQFHDFANEVILDCGAGCGKQNRVVELASLFPPLLAKDEYRNQSNNGMRPKHLTELFDESLKLNDFPTIYRNLMRHAQEFADEMVLEPSELSDRSYYYVCAKQYDLVPCTGEYQLARNQFFKTGNLRVTIGPEQSLLLWYPKLPVYRYKRSPRWEVFIQENDQRFSISFGKDAAGNTEKLVCTHPGGAVFQRKKIR